MPREIVTVHRNQALCIGGAAVLAAAASLGANAQNLNAKTSAGVADYDQNGPDNARLFETADGLSRSSGGVLIPGRATDQQQRPVIKDGEEPDPSLNGYFPETDIDTARFTGNNSESQVIRVGPNLYTTSGMFIAPQDASLLAKTQGSASDTTGLEAVKPVLESDNIFNPQAALEIPGRPIQKAIFSADGKRLFAVGEGHVNIIDVSNPDQPSPISDISLTTGRINDAIRVGNTLIITGSRGIFEVDITDLANPQINRLVNPNPGPAEQDVAYTLAYGKLIPVGSDGFVASYTINEFFGDSKTQVSIFINSGQGFKQTSTINQKDFANNQPAYVVIKDTAMVEKDGKNLVLVYAIPYWCNGTPQLHTIDITDPETPKVTGQPQNLDSIRWPDSEMAYDQSTGQLVFVDHLFGTIRDYDASNPRQINHRTGYSIPQHPDSYAGNPFLNPRFVAAGQLVVVAHQSWLIDDDGERGDFQQGQIVTIDTRIPGRPRVRFSDTGLPLAYDFARTPNRQQSVTVGNTPNQYGFFVGREGDGKITIGDLQRPTDIYFPLFLANR